MPACFQLFKIGSTEPSKFVDIDNEMCAHFNVTPHETNYYLGWYDIIGFKLAIGHTWEKILTDLGEYNDEELIAVTKWLMEHYTPNAWYERRGFATDRGSQ